MLFIYLIKNIVKNIFYLLDKVISRLCCSKDQVEVCIFSREANLFFLNRTCILYELIKRILTNTFLLNNQPLMNSMQQSQQHLHYKNQPTSFTNSIQTPLHQQSSITSHIMHDRLPAHNSLIEPDFPHVRKYMNKLPCYCV